MAKYKDLKVIELKELLRERGLKVTGKRDELIFRLEEHDSGNVTPAKKEKKEKKKKTDTTAYADEMLSRMAVSVSGARPGEYLVGVSEQSEQAIILIHDGIVPPSKEVLATLRSDPIKWQKLLERLGSINFFGEMSNDEKATWLAKHEVAGDVYIEEYAQIEVIDVGNSFMKKVFDEETIRHVTTVGKMEGKELQKLFPAKTGSKGLKGRTTLMFRRNIWAVTAYNETTDHYSGLSINTETGEIYEDLLAEDDEVIHIIGGLGRDRDQEIGIVSVLGEDLKQESLDVLQEFFEEDVTDWVNEVELGLTNFTPAGLKSVLQKIIRYRPHFVAFGNILKQKQFASDLALLIVLRKLMLSPGSFVPTIQRFVSGLESAFKRLIVTLTEDSFIAADDDTKALSVMAGALLSQRVKSWQPSSNLIRTLYDIALKGLDSDVPFDFSIQRGLESRPFTFKNADEPMELVSAILDEMKSFEGDIGLVRDIAHNFPAIGEGSSIRPKVMNIGHTIDQHWFPDMVYFYPRPFVAENSESGSTPFHPLMGRIFSEVTGVNPRRSKGRKRRTAGSIEPYDTDFEERPFVQMTQKVQELSLMVKQEEPVIKRVLLKGRFSHTYTLDRSWLAGMMGSVELNLGSGISVIVTMNPNELEELVVIRRPSREVKDGEVPAEYKAMAIETVTKQLSKGLRMKNPVFGGEKIYLIDGVYYIDKEPWDSFRENREIILPEIAPVTMTGDFYDDLRIALSNSDVKGIVPNIEQEIIELLRQSEPDDIHRMYTYLSGTKIVFNGISRDGGGSKYAVLMEDVGAFQLLLKLTLLCPGIITRRSKQLVFDVSSPPLLDLLKEWIFDYITHMEKSDETGKWPKLVDHENRKLREHQRTALEEMLYSHDNGRRGHFIYMTVRSGKTLTALTYLAKLQEMGNLPPYIIYSLPTGAYESIHYEVEAFGLRVEHLVPLKTVPKDLREYNINQGTIPNPYVVTFISHDHLRLVHQEIASLMPRSIFIIDEVHMALNETQRTTAALNMSNLSQEFIALTGTPIIDTSIYKLIWWLKQVVPFEVTQDTFWAGVAAMTTRIVKYDLVITRENIGVDILKKDLPRYRKLVAPGLGGTNSNMSPRDFMEAMDICYNSCTEAMVEKALELEDMGVFLVARNIQHQEEIKAKLIKGGVKEKDIFLIGIDGSLILKEVLVRKGKVHNYKYVITHSRKTSGYTLETLNVFINAVYPSNQAERTQVEGRILHFGKGEKYYYTFHSGVLTNVLEKHAHARSLEAVIKALGEEVKQIGNDND